MARLDGKVALIAGAGTGIGRATAQARASNAAGQAFGWGIGALHRVGGRPPGPRSRGQGRWDPEPALAWRSGLRRRRSELRRGCIPR